MKLAKQQIARQFSRAAPTYDEVAQLQCEMADRLIDRIPADASGRLVDFGCGTGYALKQLAGFPQLELVGIDIAKGMIQQAHDRSLPARLLVADLEQTDLKDQSVGIAFSNVAIQWCDTQTSFSEMARVLKPGGRLLVSTFGSGTLREWKSAWHAINDRNQRVHDFESADRLRNALVKSGFGKIEIASEIRQLVFGSVDLLLQNVKKLGATNAATDRPAGMLGRQKYLELRQHFERQLQSAGAISISFACIFIAAVRSDTNGKFVSEPNP
jgi:malonyl-CoA O-methyltransferase